MTNALLTLILALAAAQSADLLPGMPPPLDPRDVYAAGRPGNMSPAVKGFPDRIYVPNSGSNTVDVIDPHTFKIIDHFAVGKQPQHVVPSYDLKTLWVLNDLGDSLTRIDPTTGNKGETVPVIDPYNMYYTPDGKYAIVVAEAKRRLRLPRRADDEAGRVGAGALPRRRSHGFLGGRPLPHRVAANSPASSSRWTSRPERWWASSKLPDNGADAAGRAARRRTAASSTSPT